MNLDTILCLANLTAGVRNVLRTAGYLAYRRDARLRVLHVIEPSPFIAAETAGGTKQLMYATQSVLSEHLAEVLPLDIRQALDVDIAIETGSLSDSVARAAADPRVDLLVMGFFQAPHLWRAHWLDRVLRHVQKPVLSVPTRTPVATTTEWRRILIATDLRSESVNTHRAAAAMARMAKAQLIAVHVAGLSPAISAPEVLRVPEYRTFMMQELSRELRDAFVGLYPTAVTRVIAGSNPAQEIADAAAEEAADLIIVGYRKGLHLLGTLADRILSRTGTAVLVVPNTAAGRLAQAA